MGDNSNTSENATDRSTIDRLALASSNYKVRGYNEATSGATCGVLGQVDSPDGYGLATPNDARVEGAMATAGAWEFDVDGDVGLRLAAPDTFTTNGTTFEGSGNTVTGHVNNVVADVVAATISGGGLINQDQGTFLLNQVTDHVGTIGGGYGNSAGDGNGDPVSAVAATVGGGVRNASTGPYSTIGGGKYNAAAGSDSTIGGGENNTANASDSTIGGGTSNAVTAAYGAVGGGNENTASGIYSAIAGGASNTASSGYATAAGGRANTASGDYGAVGGGFGNTAGGKQSAVGGGDGNTAGADQSTVAGGNDNSVTDGSAGATISGGQSNAVTAAYGAVGGGDRNTASGLAATVGGGNLNEATALDSTVGGGLDNTASGEHSSVGGGVGNIASGDQSTVAGGEDNTATSGSTAATISGGQSNAVTAAHGTIGGGDSNTATSGATDATIGGGRKNDAYGGDSTIGGGSFNEAYGSDSTVGGGTFNNTYGDDSTIGGGSFNDVHGRDSTVAGGASNRTGKSGTSKGLYATVPGGEDNVAQEDYSFAAGHQAQSLHAGSFVWSDSRDQAFSSNGPDQFIVKADGGVGLGTNTPFAKLHVEKPAAGDAFDDPSKHVAIVENTADDDGNVDETKANTLAIRGGPSSGDPGTGVNFISFYNGGGESYGAIQGNGSGGTELKSTGSDYAEYLPKADPDQSFEAGEVVGVSEGQLVAEAAEADRAMVASDSHIVLGNSPGADTSGHEPVAFTGQVPVTVDGPVDTGELIVPAGEADGTATAVDPVEWTPADGPVVGQAWEDDDTDGVSEVTVAVGIDDPTVLGERLAAHRDRIAELEAENERKDDRIAALEERLTAVESQIGTSAQPADD